MKCVYQIRNKITGWVYIGSTVNFRTRVKQHIDALKSGKHYNYKLQKAVKEYGIENFVIEVVYPAPFSVSRSELYDIEQEFLDRVINKYNIRLLARDSVDINSIGIVCHKKFQDLVKRDIRFYTKLKGEFITTIKQAEKIHQNGGIVIRIKDNYIDKHYSEIMKYKFDYVIQNGNPSTMIYKIENMLAKFGII